MGNRDDTELADTIASPIVTSEVRSGDAGKPSEPALDVDAVLVLTRADRYAVGAELGAGGMGTVYQCTDRSIGREVALKTLSSDGPSARERFVREARVQGQLEHPAIVPVYELGTDENARPYFTMKRLRGVTFRTLIHRRARDDGGERQPMRRLLTDFAAVCHAVHFAHERGVIHRDIKPENIMVGDYGEVYLLDWGIARERSSDPTFAPGPATGSTPGATSVGTILGTPGYMAPEQVRGDVAAVNERSDVYALGAVLFELLTGQPVNQGDTLEEVLAETLTGVDARISHRFPDLDVAPELEELCLRAVRTRPADRLPSAGAMVARLDAYLDGDRDLARRRELAAAHAERARKALAGSDLQARSLAMREAGRALALDPDHREAAALVSRLLLEVPDQTPPEVAAELSRTEHRSTLRLSRLANLLALVIILALPLYSWVFQGGWTLALALFMPLAVTFWETRRIFRSPDPQPRSLQRLLWINGVFVMVIAYALGPLLLVPAIAAFTSLAFAMHYHLRPRWLVGAIGLATVTVPLVLEWLGVWAPSYRFTHGELTILPRAAAFSAVPTLITLMATSVIIIVVTMAFINTLRDSHLAAERKLLVQAWHLRQLAPPDLTPGPGADGDQGEADTIKTATRPPPDRRPPRE